MIALANLGNGIIMIGVFAAICVTLVLAVFLLMKTDKKKKE